MVASVVIFFLLGLFRWCCFSFGLVLVLVSVFSSTLSHSLTCFGQSKVRRRRGGDGIC